MVVRASANQQGMQPLVLQQRFGRLLQQQALAESRLLLQLDPEAVDGSVHAVQNELSSCMLGEYVRHMDCRGMERWASSSTLSELRFKALRPERVRSISRAL